MECDIKRLEEAEEVPETPAKRKPVKEDCFWYSSFRDSCGALNCLQCDINGRCSFFETPEEYRERNKNRNRKKR